MTPAEFQKMLDEHRIPPLLLLYGEEGFLLDRAVHRVCESAVPRDARDFNYQVFQGKDIAAAVVLDAARTLPIFSPRRLILLRDLQHVPAGELELFLPYLRDPLPETVLLFTADKIDGRKKFFQEFRKRGELVEFRRLYDNQIPAFVREQAKGAGRTLTEDAMALFCRRTGNDLREIHAELTKLFSYLGEKTLADVEDVAAVVSDTRADSIFDLTNALGAGRTQEALRLTGRLLEDGMAPLLILNMMVRHYRNLWKTRELVDKKATPGEIAKRVGVNPYFVEGLTAQARRVSPASFQRGFELFLAADLALKSSGAHPSALLEKLVLDLGEGRGR